MQPKLDAGIDAAVGRLREAEAAVEVARSAVGAALRAKVDVTGPLEGRLAQIDGALRRSAPAGLTLGDALIGMASQALRLSRQAAGLARPGRPAK